MTDILERFLPKDPTDAQRAAILEYAEATEEYDRRFRAARDALGITDDTNPKPHQGETLSALTDPVWERWSQAALMVEEVGLNVNYHNLLKELAIRMCGYEQPA